MTDKQAKRVILVLSTGRSGTSLLMKALRAMGMRLSEKMIPGSVGNPEGFFEDAEIVDVHKNLLVALDTHPSLPLPDHWLESDAAAKARLSLRKILENNLANSDTIWGFKDPRTVSFLPLWNRILNAQGIVPVFFLAVREPGAVVSSLKRQINREGAITELQWLQRTTDALYHTAADCFIVHYEDWFTKPTELAQGLLAYTCLDQFFTGSIDKAIKDVIKPDLNRAVYEDYQVQNEYVLKLYDVLKDCRGNEFDRERLMGAVKECRHAMNGFKGWYTEAHKDLGQQAATRERLEKERARIEELKAKLAKEQESIKKNQDEIDNVRKNDLHEITLQNNQYLKQLKDLHDEKENLRISISSIQNELAEIKKAKTALEQARERELKEKQGQLTQAQSEVDKLKKELEQVSVLEQEKEKTLKEKQDQLKNLNDEKENLHIRLSSVQNELAEIKKAKTALEQSREKQNQQALQQKEMTHHYRQFIKRLYTLIRSLEKDYLAIKNSYTWRTGDFLVRCMELLLFRRKRPLVMDHLEQIFQGYKDRMPLFEPGQKELAQFKRWVKQIEKDFIDLFASRRWRVGNGFVFIMGGTRFSRKKFTARDHIERILEDFNETYKDKKSIDINILETKQPARQINSEYKKN